ncbi:hypothetical protein [Silvimonas sp.]|uniref:phosphoribosyltransferase-like protein n=1 Tax=Silvimonas sp. TaxID=2650811 RepID=UPI00284B2C98|nr:hypothetical protein [Silvimonas sp.]MDR3427740.1 hypothetical protein [Silvimonas sp.]
MSFQEHCIKIAEIIADYREGEIAAPDAVHVGRWIEQFPAPAREPLLVELAHVLRKSYLSRKVVTGFIERVIASSKIAGNDPASFWRSAHFLRLQQAGNSQRDMLAIFDEALTKAYGLTTADCGKAPHTYVYLDDGIFSGGRVKSDLIRWITNNAPQSAKVAVIVMVLHKLGEYFAGQDIQKAAQAAGKTIEISWWRATAVEDRKTYIANSDVLRPKGIPIEAQAYVASLGVDPVLRVGEQVGGLGLFSSPAGRELVEQEFLKAGVQVRACCPHFNDYMRPLAGC